MTRSGRPRSGLRGNSDAINELALLLQDQLRQARMSVRDLCKAFDESHFQEGCSIPSHATVQRRLSGENLATARPLINAIITICTPAAEVQSVQKHAMELLRKAAISPPRNPVGADSGAETSELRAQLGILQRQHIATQRELHAERRQRSDASPGLSLTMMWLLGSLHATRDQEQPGSADATVADLQRRLLRIEKERDATKSALVAATRRIQDLESQLSSQPEAGAPTRPENQTEPTTPAPLQRATNAELETLERGLRSRDPDGNRMAAVLRRALDFPLDGSHTGRFRWDQLSKTEKTTLGTRVEIELRRAFGFDPGGQLDFKFNDIEFDCRYAMSAGRWSIPPEAHGKICLLITADDQTSSWSVGLVRADPELLNSTHNRSGSTTLNALGRSAIRWLHQDATLPNNALIHLPQADIDAIFTPRSSISRMVELFRRAQHQPISRTVAATVALNDQYERRIREAQGPLTEEGIIILRGSPDGQDIARRLDLPIPGVGEWVSARITALRDVDENTPHFEAEGQRWVLAMPHDPIAAAPSVVR
ncbi:NaeI family type II restriction endonuclease [Nocardia sp. NPDC057440]|uniref:NaeI family type II restriction endonuclease n=1 Tax=Nocardia sp. NPDC057440 TaxID=3346134 RepID=UPI00366A82C3